MARNFLKHIAELVEAIDSPTSFANDFYNEGLIGKETRDAITEVENTRVRVDKATELVRFLETRVKYNSDVFPTVIPVLRNTLPPCKLLADKMAEKGNPVRKN